MMDFIRRNAASWMMKIILGAIVVVFVFWGVGTFRSGRLDVVAKVNGEKILLERFTRQYNQTIEQYQRMFGGTVPEALLKGMNIKQQVLDDLINQEVIRQEAEKMGVHVSDREVQDVILGMEVFQNNGTFDPNRYQMALRNARIAPADFERQVRQEIRIRKIQALLASGIHVTSAEIEQRYRFENQEISLALVKIPASSCQEDVQVDEEELAAWYEKNKEEFRTRPQVKLRYVLLPLTTFEKMAEVSDEEIAKWYQDHQAEYHQPETRRARHILVKVGEDADEAAVEAARKRAEEVLAKAKSGADFAELAKEYSDDPGSKDRGGDLGFFKRGTMVKPFEDAVFSMKPKEITGPVRTKFGFHIIQLEEIRPEKTPPLEEVRPEIEALLKRQKAKQLMWESANRAYDTIIEMGSLDAYAQAEGLKLEESGFFSKQDPPAFLGRDPGVLDAVFSLNSGELSSLLEVPSGILIAEVVEKKVPYVPSLEDVRQRAESLFVQDKARELCAKKAEKLIETARQEGLAAAAEEMGLKVEHTGFFKRGAQAGPADLPVQLFEKARDLYPAQGKDLLDQPLAVGDMFYVAALEQVKDADPEGLSQVRKELEAKLRQQKAEKVFTDWLTDARNRAVIEVKRDL